MLRNWGVVGGWNDPYLSNRCLETVVQYVSRSLWNVTSSSTTSSKHCVRHFRLSPKRVGHTFALFLVLWLLLAYYYCSCIYRTSELDLICLLARMPSSTIGSVLLAPSPADAKYDTMYYLKGAAAGGICCSITHGALTPVDVVKTRVQLDPAKVCRKSANLYGVNEDSFLVSSLHLFIYSTIIL